MHTHNTMATTGMDATIIDQGGQVPATS